MICAEVLGPITKYDLSLCAMFSRSHGGLKESLHCSQAEAFDKIFQKKMAGYPPKLFPYEEF